MESSGLRNGWQAGSSSHRGGQRAAGAGGRLAEAAGRAGQRAHTHTHKLQSSFQLWALEGATSAVWCRLALAVML